MTRSIVFNKLDLYYYSNADKEYRGGDFVYINEYSLEKVIKGLFFDKGGRTKESWRLGYSDVTKKSSNPEIYILTPGFLVLQRFNESSWDKDYISSNMISSNLKSILESLYYNHGYLEIQIGKSLKVCTKSGEVLLTLYATEVQTKENSSSKDDAKERLRKAYEELSESFGYPIKK